MLIKLDAVPRKCQAIVDRNSGIKTISSAVLASPVSVFTSIFLHQSHIFLVWSLCSSPLSRPITVLIFISCPALLSGVIFFTFIYFFSLVFCFSLSWTVWWNKLSQSRFSGSLSTLCIATPQHAESQQHNCPYVPFPSLCFSRER